MIFILGDFNFVKHYSELKFPFRWQIKRCDRLSQLKKLSTRSEDENLLILTPLSIFASEAIAGCEDSQRIELLNAMVDNLVKVLTDLLAESPSPLRAHVLLPYAR